MKQKKCQVRIEDEDCYDSHDGELYCSLKAKNEFGQLVGYIDYSIFEGETNIKMIEVHRECKHHGIASKLLEKLEKEYPKINYGFTTREGTEFLKEYKLKKGGNKNA